MRLERKLIILLRFIIFALIVFSVGSAYCQQASQGLSIKNTLLQVASGFYSVKSNAQVDLDSSLVISAKRYKGSIIPIITEGMEDDFRSINMNWINKNEAESVKQKLLNLRGPEHTRLALLLGAFYTFHPGFHKAITELAISYLLQAKKESDILNNQEWSLQAAILLGKCYFKEDNFAQGKAWFSVVTGNKTNSDIQILAKAWNYEAMYCPFLPETISFRITCLNNALKLYEQINDHGNEINTLMNIAYLSFAGGKLDDAKSAALKSISLQKAERFFYQQYSYDLISYISGVEAKTPDQIRYALTAVNLAENNRDTLNLGHFYFNVSAAYKNEKEDNEASLWHFKSLNAFERYGGDPELWHLLAGFSENSLYKKNSSRLLALIKDTWKKYPPNDVVAMQYAYIAEASSYQNEKKFTDAQHYLLLAKDLENKNQLLKGGIESFHLDYTLGRNYINLNKIDSAKKYLLQVINSPQSTESYKMHSYYGLYLIDSSKQRYREAMLDIKQYSDIFDKTSTKIESNQISALSVQYHTLQREKSIQSLKEQNLFQKQKEESSKKLFYISVVVLLLVIVIIYGRYHLNRKRNREIDTQNTILQQMNAKQQSLLAEKELLLREIHHRVKNNLQTTMSLLNIQSAHIDNEVALETIRSSQHRMHAMSLIHQKLYQSEKLTAINMAVYIEELTSYLRESFYVSNNILYKLNLKPLEFDIAEAIPIGLIINEAVTNSIKYAFPEKRSGTISIMLDKDSHNNVILKIKDNGIGISNSENTVPGKSLGLSLMEGLTGQLQGEFEIKNNHGTEINIRFNYGEMSGTL